MTLGDLNAEIKGGVLLFDCPTHRDHRIRVPLKGLAAPNQHGCAWDHVGTLPDITIWPSVNAEGCWHGFITAGALTSC